jgi:hypothetical protein
MKQDKPPGKVVGVIGNHWISHGPEGKDRNHTQEEQDPKRTGCSIVLDSAFLRPLTAPSVFDEA